MSTVENAPNVFQERATGFPEPQSASFLSASPRDLGCHRPRSVVDTLFPGKVDEVRQIVKAAARARAPLYPLSTGKNWGMGSGFPVSDGCTVLDLSTMNTIRALDLEHGYAVIEAGVTQRQLAEQLLGTPWMLNVTSACADTSIVGNALDRGDGTIRARSEDILGVEAVLGTGETMTTSGLDRQNRYRGAVTGPDLTMAFVQSNLGVVTAMAISLMPRPEMIHLVHATFGAENLPEVAAAVTRLDRLALPAATSARLWGHWLLPSAAFPPLPAFAVPDQLTLMLPLLGPREVVALTGRVLQDAYSAVNGFLSFQSLDTATVAEDDPLYPRALLARGIPTCASLRTSIQMDSCDADNADTGWLMFLPVIPLDEASITTAVALMRREVERHALPAMVEFNIVSRHTANMVIQIPFPRETNAISRAHALRDAARSSFIEAGFLPYRSDIDHAPREIQDSKLHSTGPLDRLKELFDPFGIISPGRYLAGRISETSVTTPRDPR